MNKIADNPWVNLQYSHLDYLIEKANRLGLDGKKIGRVFVTHYPGSSPQIEFEVDGRVGGVLDE